MDTHDTQLIEMQESSVEVWFFLKFACLQRLGLHNLGSGPGRGL